MFVLSLRFCPFSENRVPNGRMRRMRMTTGEEEEEEEEEDGKKENGEKED